MVTSEAETVWQLAFKAEIDAKTKLYKARVVASRRFVEANAAWQRAMRMS
ncbi:MAG: hypothetical protein ACREAG_00710 [Nitrosopumilaceae archaeon]